MRRPGRRPARGLLLLAVVLVCQQGLPPPARRACAAACVPVDARSRPRPAVVPCWQRWGTRAGTSSTGRSRGSRPRFWTTASWSNLRCGQPGTARSSAGAPRCPVPAPRRALGLPPLGCVTPCGAQGRVRHAVRELREMPVVRRPEPGARVRQLPRNKAAAD